MPDWELSPLACARVANLFCCWLLVVRIILPALITIVAFAACERHGAITYPRSSPAQSPAAANQTSDNVDAGNLLTGDEIRSVLGERLNQPITSTRAESGFVISQCYFLLSAPSKSAALTVTSRGAGEDARDPREFWMEKFHDDRGGENHKEGDEQERKPAPPEPISGVGDEAYWLESGSTGALYVLQGNSFIRVAIGGTDDKTTRVPKATKLAQFALKRLPLH